MSGGICGMCGGTIRDWSEYHPFLYCELVKLGHEDPASYLNLYGFERTIGDWNTGPLRNTAPRPGSVAS